MKRNWVDRAIEYIAPVYGLRRYQARIRTGILSRHYEAASRDRRTSGWKTSSKDATSLIAAAKTRVRDNVRDLARNNPFATAALDGLESHVIGTGIETVFRNKDGTTNKRLTDKFKQWAESTESDFARTTSYYGNQAAAFRCTVEAGESLGLMKIESGKNPRFCVKLLEPDFIDDRRTEYKKDVEQTIDGILVDAEGRKKGFYLFSRHPGGLEWGALKGLESKFYAAEDVAHMYRLDRIGQLRGMSWFAPVVALLKELDEMMDATLLKQKIAAAFAAFVKDVEGFGTPASMKSEHAIGEEIEPGIIEILPPGKDVTFANPPAATDFGPFTRAILHAYSAGIRVPYHVVTGDASGFNFSSGRMIWQGFARKIEQWQWNMIVPQFCTPIAYRWLKFQAILGEDVDGVYPTFVTPTLAAVDPAAETNAVVTQIRAGIKTLPDAIREQGFDPVEKIKEVAEFNKLLDKYGVVFDTDARKVTKSGITQSADSSEPPTKDEDTSLEDTEGSVDA